MKPISHLTSSREWRSRLARSPHALGLLFLLSMLETWFLPVPLELVLIPWMLCHCDRRWAIATAALAGNLTAALIGYYFGFFLMDQWGPELINFFGDQESFNELEQQLREDGFVTILTIGISPLPFQIAMLAAGATAYPVVLFILAAMLSRGIRYFGLALLVGLIGPRALEFWKRYSMPLGIVIAAILGIWLWRQFAV